MNQRDLAIPARVLAQGLHADQVDAQGHPRPQHLAWVAHRVAEHAGQRHPAVAVAWLHLALAHGGLQQRELEAAFGADIAGAVGALTPRPGESAQQHEARLLANDLAAVVWHQLPCADQELVAAC